FFRTLPPPPGGSLGKPDRILFAALHDALPICSEREFHEAFFRTLPPPPGGGLGKPDRVLFAEQESGVGADARGRIIHVTPVGEFEFPGFNSGRRFVRLFHTVRRCRVSETARES